MNKLEIKQVKDGAQVLLENEIAFAIPILAITSAYIIPDADKIGMTTVCIRIYFHSLVTLEHHPVLVSIIL